MSWHQSQGIIRYYEYSKVVLEVDKTITDYYYSLIPKWLNPQKVGWKPHITIVRKDLEFPLFWEFKNGELLSFEYNSLIRFERKHFWIDCRSKEIEFFRECLSLNSFRDGYKQYHITIGFKND